MDDARQSPAPGQRAVSRRQFLKRGCGTLLGAAAMGALGSVYATRVEPDWIEVTRVDVPLPDWLALLDGFTVAHLSDFHLGPYVSAVDVRRSVEVANALEPDLIVLTGDFVYRSADYSAPWELISMHSVPESPK